METAQRAALAAGETALSAQAAASKALWLLRESVRTKGFRLHGRVAVAVAVAVALALALTAGVLSASASLEVALRLVASARRMEAASSASKGDDDG